MYYTTSLNIKGKDYIPPVLPSEPKQVETPWSCGTQGMSLQPSVIPIPPHGKAPKSLSGALVRQQSDKKAIQRKI